MLTFLGSLLRSDRRSTDSEEVGPEEKDFSKGLGSRWCLAERAGEDRRMGLAGGLVAVAGRGEWTASIVGGERANIDASYDTRFDTDQPEW